MVKVLFLAPSLNYLHCLTETGCHCQPLQVLPEQPQLILQYVSDGPPYVSVEALPLLKL